MAHTIGIAGIANRQHVGGGDIDKLSFEGPSKIRYLVMNYAGVPFGIFWEPL